MKNLPKYWVVERTKENTVLFRKTVIPYLLETYGEYWNGIGYKYYGFDGNEVFKGTNCHNFLENFENNPVLLTLDEFIKLTTKEETMIDFKIKGTELPCMKDIRFRCSSWNSNNYQHLNFSGKLVSFGHKVFNGVVHILAEKSNYTGSNYFMFKESDVIEAAKKQGMYKEEFVLPEKWCIKVTEVNKPTLRKWLESKDDFNMDYIYIKDWVLSNPRADHSYQFWASHIPLDYTEITFEQFEKYVLKQKEEVMEKQITGYKLKKDCQQYLDAAEAIAANGLGVDFKIGDNLEYYLQKPEWGTYKKRLEEAGVLDLWFEPVYEEVYKYKVGDWVVVLPEDPYYFNCEQGCAQQIADIDFNRKLPYRLRFSNKSTNEYSKIRLATPEEIKKATTKEFPIGKYTAVVKNGKIIIDDIGEVSIKLFNRFFENYLTHTLTKLDGFKVYIGCVENVTLAQAKELYNYTKTL